MLREENLTPEPLSPSDSFQSGGVQSLVSHLTGNAEEDYEILGLSGNIADDMARIQGSMTIGAQQARERISKPTDEGAVDKLPLLTVVGDCTIEKCGDECGDNGSDGGGDIREDTLLNSKTIKMADLQANDRERCCLCLDSFSVGQTLIFLLAVQNAEGSFTTGVMARATWEALWVGSECTILVPSAVVCFVVQRVSLKSKDSHHGSASCVVKKITTWIAVTTVRHYSVSAADINLLSRSFTALQLSAFVVLSSVTKCPRQPWKPSWPAAFVKSLSSPGVRLKKRSGAFLIGLKPLLPLLPKTFAAEKVACQCVGLKLKKFW